VLVLDAHNTTTPCSSEFFVVVELLGEVLCKVLEVLEVFLMHLSQGNAGSGLHVDEFAKVGFATNEGVGDLLLSAKSWQVNDGLDGINIVGQDDKLSLGLFNQSGNMVETELKVDWFVGLNSDGLLSLSLESELLGLLGLGRVLGQHLEKLGG